MRDGGIALICCGARDAGAQLGCGVTVRDGDIAQQIERLVELLDRLPWVAVEQG